MSTLSGRPVAVGDWVVLRFPEKRDGRQSQFDGKRGKVTRLIESRGVPRGDAFIEFDVPAVSDMRADDHAGAFKGICEEIRFMERVA